jgi:hypothetical protein
MFTDGGRRTATHACEGVMAELLFCEIARTITRTTSHDWHVQPFVKDPGKSALGGCFRLLMDSNTRRLAVVLETFQTYYAIFRAVNPAALPGIGEHRRSTQPFPLHLLASLTEKPQKRRGSKRATCRSSSPLQLFQRAKAPERSNSLKILYWRFRDSR